MSIKLGIYRHYKGNNYQVLGLAKHSETLEELVVYKPLYNNSGLWVRPLSMFKETVQHDGSQQSRFTLIEETTI